MRLKKTLAVVAVMAVAASMSAPALAKGRDEGRGGKKAIGEVTTFDAATGALAVTLVDGTVSAGTVTEDTQIKVEHRGGRKAKGAGNPTKGSAEDLVAGTKVLRLKMENDGVTVDKIRLRRAAAAPVEEAPAEGDDSGDESETGEDPAAEPVVADPVDGGTGDDGTVTDPIVVCDPLTDPLGCVTP